LYDGAMAGCSQVGQTALMAAARRGHVDAIRLLLSFSKIEKDARDQVSDLAARGWHGIAFMEPSSWAYMFCNWSNIQQVSCTASNLLAPDPV
jgi:ankyrin repeat protein